MEKAEKRNRSSRPKVFLIFLLSAITFWIFAKFSKQYTSTIEVELAYTDLPENTLLANGNSGSVKVDLNANGFKILYYGLKTPKVSIPLSKYHQPNDTVIRLGEEVIRGVISEQLDKNKTLNNLLPRELSISLDRIISKKLPVQLITQIDYREGFKLVGEPVVQPDSVMVSGPSESLDSLMVVVTEPLLRSGLSTNISEVKKLVVPPANRISLDVVEVAVTIEVSEFTQKEITVPIEVVNLPAGTSIKLIPESITLRFDVSLNDFRSISGGDFRVICDYTERNQEENFMLPNVIQRPESVQQLELSVKKIDYLVFK